MMNWRNRLSTVLSQGLHVFFVLWWTLCSSCIDRSFRKGNIHTQQARTTTPPNNKMEPKQRLTSFNLVFAGYRTNFAT